MDEPTTRNAWRIARPHPNVDVVLLSALSFASCSLFIWIVLWIQTIEATDSDSRWWFVPPFWTCLGVMGLLCAARAVRIGWRFRRHLSRWAVAAAAFLLLPAAACLVYWRFLLIVLTGIIYVPYVAIFCLLAHIGALNEARPSPGPMPGDSPEPPQEPDRPQ